uniref:Disks large homolog 5-like n=1 Tax=Petromyzon marinus TaxID=7757 RepID=A0AAJ7SK84_PETMA
LVHTSSPPPSPPPLPHLGSFGSVGGGGVKPGRIRIRIPSSHSLPHTNTATRNLVSPPPVSLSPSPAVAQAVDAAALVVTASTASTATTASTAASTASTASTTATTASTTGTSPHNVATAHGTQGERDSQRGGGCVEVRQVTLEREGEKLGISIAGGERGGVFVSRVEERSLAQRAGLGYGDQLLEYNGINLRNATEQQAKLIIGQTETGSTVTLLTQPQQHSPTSPTHHG